MLDRASQPQRKGSVSIGRRPPCRMRWVRLMKHRAKSRRLRLTTWEPTKRPLKLKKMAVNHHHTAVVRAASSPRKGIL
jgi:hypothetical protein